MKTIIAATDFSEEAENAIQYAAALAKQTGAKLLLFNSFNLPVHTANSLLPEEVIRRMEEDNKLLLCERAAELAERYGIDVGIKSGLFLLIEEGLDVLYQESQADLVVMGMAARSIEQDIFGNTTTSVILKLKYPVLAVPKTAVFDRINSILFACEDLRKVEEPVKEKIRNLARQLGAELEVFHVENESAQKKADQEKDLTEFEGITCSYKDYSSDNVIKAIQKEIKDYDAKLLIMIPQRHGFWESIIHKSKTRMMASGLSIPLLSIPQ